MVNDNKMGVLFKPKSIFRAFSMHLFFYQSFLYTDYHVFYKYVRRSCNTKIEILRTDKPRAPII